MTRRHVVCPHCDLQFMSALSKTYCPGCHVLIEPRELA